MRNSLLSLLLLLSACGGGDQGVQDDLSVVLNADKGGGVAPLAVNFTASVPGGGNEVGYTWDFGTGDTAQGSPSRAYVFKQAGTYLVSVRASKDAQTATASVNVNVSAPPAPPPVAPENGAPTVTLKASRTAGKAPLEINFSAVATDPNGDALSYTWNFGDGQTTSGDPVQTHTFTEAGAYTAAVTVADGRGGVTQAERRIAVTNPDPQVPPTAPPPVPPTAPKNKAPEVSLSASETEGSAPLTVSFKADASDPEGEPLSYSWNFGNGEKAEGNSSRTLTYTEPGSYTALVTVSDGLAETSAEMKISVVASAAPPPENSPPEEVTAVADPPSGTTPLQVEFSASASDADADTLIYLWDFGDGVISSENPARHTYQKAGTYHATVTVGDRKGGKTREQVTVEVSGGDANTPDVPFYGEWAWAASSRDNETFTGYLSISKTSSRADSGLEEFFLRGGKGAWTYCRDGLEACGAPTGVGRIDVLDFGDGEAYDIVFIDGKTGFDKLVAYDDDDRIENEDGAPTFRGGGAWYADDGSSTDLSFTMVKVDNDPQTALTAALNALTAAGN